MIEDDTRHFPQMDGQRIFKLALRHLPAVAEEVLNKAGLTMDDIDIVVPHQANLRINQAFQKRMELPEEKVFHNVQKYGNTTSASIPLALYDAIEQKRVDPEKSTVMIVALGAGLTWGGMIFRFGK